MDVFLKCQIQGKKKDPSMPFEGKTRPVS